MLKIGKLIAAMAIAALVLPAAAGSAKSLVAIPPQSADGFVSGPGEAGWSLEQYSYFRTEEGPGETVYAPRKFTAREPAKDVGAAKGSVDGFNFVGGESGWQLAPHKFLWSAGHFVHSDECDHVIRTAKGPTLEELESARNISPGG